MRLCLATLNTWALPEPFSQKPGPRLDAIARRIASLSVDAIAFQEVWTPSARARLDRAGRDAGLEHVWHNDASLGGSGLLVLSRLPIEEAHFERFSLAGRPERVTQADYFGGKGFVRLRVATPGGPVELVDTHLQARYAMQGENCYAPQRAGQVVQLALGLRGIRDPVIVLGDFNCGERDAEHRVLLGLTGLRDVAVALDRCEPTVLRSNPYRSRHRRADLRVDLVLARDGRERRVVPRSVRRIFDETFLLDGELASYSDHAGVRTELEIEAGPGAPPPPPDPAILELARSLLDQGRAEAEGRRRQHREWAGVGVAGASVVALAQRAAPQLTRRRLLHGGLQGAALLALASTGACSLLAERFEPSEIRAFGRLCASLPSLAEARARAPLEASTAA